MRFRVKLALKNIKANPGRSALLIIICAFLATAVFGGSVFIDSIANGLNSYQTRLGADIIVIPKEIEERGSFEGILIQGIPDTFYMDSTILDGVRGTEGIEYASPQFFLATAAASCCDSPVQIIGFDPDTDFSIKPWIKESYDGNIEEGDIIVGSNIYFDSSRKLKFYNVSCNVSAQLEKTGTGLDNAVYANMDTIKKIIKSADNLGFEKFKGVDPDSVISAVMIRTKDDYDIKEAAGNINFELDGVSAFTSQKMISGITQGIKNVTSVIKIVIAIIWILSMIILTALFSLIAGERVKEVAILRIIGASKQIIVGTLRYEAFFIALFGSLSGVAAVSVIFFPFLDTIKRSLELPVLRSDIGYIFLAMITTVVLSVIICEVTWTVCVIRIARKDVGLLSKEE